MSFNETFSDIANRFQTWSQADNVGTLVTNNRKDYLNRAQRWLQQERDWDGQVEQTSLTVRNSYASLPSDLVSLVAVGYDQEGDGKAEWFYYKSGRRGHGYRLVPTFTKAAGLSWQIQLFSGWPYVPNLVLYQKRLEDFEDSGTEYSFFPGELLLRVAQMIRQGEFEKGSDKYNRISRDVDVLLKKYIGLQFQNNEMRRVIVDDNGNPIHIDAYSLTGGKQKQPSWIENSRDTNG